MHLLGLESDARTDTKIGDQGQVVRWLMDRSEVYHGS
jgi:hypothetical protein